jgi:hypothetical protein
LKRLVAVAFSLLVSLDSVTQIVFGNTEHPEEKADVVSKQNHRYLSELHLIKQLPCEGEKIVPVAYAVNDVRMLPH